MSTFSKLSFPRVTWNSALWLLPVLVLAPNLHPAHAYLDPGTGSYIIQMSIGVLFGATYACKTFIKQTLAKIRSRGNKKKDE